MKFKIPCLKSFLHWKYLVTEKYLQLIEYSLFWTFYSNWVLINGLSKEKQTNNESINANDTFNQNLEDWTYSQFHWAICIFQSFLYMHKTSKQFKFIMFIKFSLKQMNSYGSTFLLNSSPMNVITNRSTRWNLVSIWTAYETLSR